MLRLSQAGDVDALGALLAQYRSAWIAAALWRGARIEDAEDIVQDVAEELIRALPTLDPARSIAGNGRRRAVSRAIDVRRTQLARARREAAFAASATAAVHPTVLADLEAAEMHQRLIAVAARVLAPGQLEEFRKHAADPFAGTTAIGRRSTKPEMTARIHWYRARQRLIRELRRLET